MRTQLTAPAIRARKVRDGGDPLVMVTAYDAPGARIADEAGVDLILVGDSVAMVVLGYDDTLQVTVDDIAHHTGAVARAKSAPTARPEAARRGRPAVDELPRLARRHGPQRRPADPGRRPGGEARGRPQAPPDDRGHRRRRDPGDGPPRPHPAVGPRHGRLQGAGPRARRRARAGRRRQGAGRTPAASPSCSRACPTRSPAWSPTPSTCPPSASAPAPAATARCSCSTTSSASRTASPPKFVRRYADVKADERGGARGLRRRRAHRRLPGRRRELPPRRPRWPRRSASTARSADRVARSRPHGGAVARDGVP